jgi:tetratricopeptide (TPR) repeat protein
MAHLSPLDADRNVAHALNAQLEWDRAAERFTNNERGRRPTARHRGRTLLFTLAVSAELLWVPDWSPWGMTVRRYEEAVAEARRARELSLLSPVINVELGGALVRIGRYDEAIQQAHKALEIDRSSAART